MVLVAVKVVPAGSKPPAALGERISKSERHGFGASAPLLTTTSSLRGRAEGSAVMPKLVKLVGPASTLFADSSPRLRVYLPVGPSTSVARRGYRACARSLQNADLVLSCPWGLLALVHKRGVQRLGGAEVRRFHPPGGHQNNPFRR